MAKTASAPIINTEEEKKELLRRYRSLLKSCRRKLDKNNKLQIRKAFDVAMEAHQDARRKSGEPYIYHPISVAQICAEEIGLGPTSVICALMHDVVEDTDMTLADMKGMFGEKVAQIIDGLTKIKGVEIIDPTNFSIQAENFRKMLLTLSDDVRVILIKLADRLHNMRTLESMSEHQQRKIASETLYLYAPLAHRLGLNAIKTELEDLGLKYTEPEVYHAIETKLKESEPERKKYINKFTDPILEALIENGFKLRVFGRPKSIYSIYSKMRSKNLPYEEIYDIFAIRIIIDSKEEDEKADCWKVYSVVTDFYYPNPERLRDWISTPKGNGYEALHTTVMGPEGKWVEVQIRSERMDEIAERGFAAHWRYKTGTEDAVDKESQLDDWLKKIRHMLESADENALDFLDDFKLNLFAEEIFVFTPKGEMRSLPSSATALDFAFEIHSKVGEQCIGAKVNHKLVPLSHPLNSGDQVEILTSAKQSPKQEWVNYVVTAKAKAKIKAALKEDKRKVAGKGSLVLEKRFKSFKLAYTTENINKVVSIFKLPNAQELHYRIAIGNIKPGEIKDFRKEKNKTLKAAQKEKVTLEELVTSVRGKSDLLVIGDNMENIEYRLSPCCHPIPGDDVFGFITINEGIKIHRVNCPNATKMLANHAYRVVKARWTNQELISFLAGIRMTGTDRLGVMNNLTKIISSELNINMRSLSFDTNDGVFEGKIMLFVHDTKHLTELMGKLKKVPGVQTVSRFDTN
ncbi:MAG: bifunctional (p)ppGpp synthetase/guanosine-3',5'-bis(diphosphate) 3'-pyrophosphohydrolase [Bacteroidetes bacterium]|nr:MAG: bifunctional (p)ppGpp synthetase/guanosine-3',5'-bis(diphosphate) 3'-pyrophosphohydrolase [Bacteroidota bacterium]